MNIPRREFRRQPDVPGIPPVDWITDRTRVGWQTAKTDRNRMIRFVREFGLEATLAGDIVDLLGIAGGGKSTQLRRKVARRAQRLLQEYHAGPGP